MTTSNLSPYCVIIITLLLAMYIYKADKGKRLRALALLPLCVLVQWAVMAELIESSFSAGVFILTMIAFLIGKQY